MILFYGGLETQECKSAKENKESEKKLRKTVIKKQTHTHTHTVTNPQTVKYNR